MLSLVRCAPKILLIESKNIEQLEHHIVSNYKAYKCDFDTAFEKSNENCIIIFLLDKMNKIVKFTDPKSIIVIEIQSDIFLSDIISSKVCHLVSKIRIAPVMIIMRAFGNIDKIIKKIQEVHKCKIGTTSYLWQEHNSGSLIVFTKSPLNKVITYSDLYENALLIDQEYNSLMEEFRMRGLEYLNSGIDNRDWYEFEIKIYDRYSQYRLHYQKLLKIIEDLEIGLILGESWGKDSALFFLNVEVYRIRLFTFYDPKYIKEILLGMEYIDSGLRIVDYDLFYKRRKINWTAAKDKENTDRVSLGKKHRNRIFSQLNPSQIKEIIEIEDKILKTRY